MNLTLPRSVATPCVQVCAVDGESGLCLGCFRTLPEIAQWSRFSDTERAALMAALPARRSRIAPELRPADRERIHRIARRRR